jgi:hypothetical protein
MDYSQVKELYYICHSGNIGSIIKNGLLCHESVKQLPHLDVSMQEVQNRRENKIVPGGMKLHNYVNLYFDARNPMMYKRREMHNELCVLVINPDVMQLQKVTISDGNAAASYIRFYSSPDGLKNLDYELVFAEFWIDRNDDEITKAKKKAIKCAEVLVPYKVDSKYILRCYVSNEKTKKEIDSISPGFDVIINSNLFFQVEK